MPRPAPFDFVFDYLPRQIVVKPMFGMHYIYFNKKIVLLLRKANKNLNLNGIWVPSSKEHHQSLQIEIPALTDFILDTGDTHDSGWRFLSQDHEDFETSAIKLCELIAHNDKRIGKETKASAGL